MATFHGDCEPLHGHNYDLFIDIEGELTEDAWVWDFGDLKRTTKSIADELDHKFILQLESPLLNVEEQPESWTISFGERTYVFPKSDVAALPIDNSTAERIAEWIANRLLPVMQSRPGGKFRKLSVGVEEMPGQAGWYTVELE